MAFYYFIILFFTFLKFCIFIYNTIYLNKKQKETNMRIYCASRRASLEELGGCVADI